MSMNIKESIERFDESMKRAASRAKELSVIYANPTWGAISKSLMDLGARGKELALAKSRSRSDIDRDIELHKARMAAASPQEQKTSEEVADGR